MFSRNTAKRKTVDDANSEREAPETKKLQKSELFRMSYKFHDNTEAQFDNARFSDVKIYINNKVFQAHRFILVRNSIFNQMLTEKPNLTEICLYNEVIDLTGSETTLTQDDPDYRITINISDVTSESCETFLRYLYNPTLLDEVKIGPELVLVAHKFNDDTLKEFCEKYLVERIKLKNVVRYLLLSIKAECKKLKQSTCQLIARNFSSIKNRKSFKPILADDQLLMAILEVFDDCEVTLLTDQKYYDACENQLEYLRSVDLTLSVKNHHFLTQKVFLERNVMLKKKISAALTVKDGLSNYVYISQFDEETFGSFLNYIYTGEVRSSDISSKLLELAVKYKDEKLKNCCEAKFCKRLDVNNAIEFLMIAQKFDCKKLENDAAQYSIVRYKEVSKTADFQKLIKSPKAAAVIIKASCERLEKETIKDFFNDRFIMDLPIDSKSDVLSKNFAVKDRVCFIRLMLSDDQQYLGVFLSVMNCVSDIDLHYSFKLMSADEKRIVKLMKSRRQFGSAIDLKEETGWMNFISLARLNNSDIEIVKDGKIVLSVDVTAV